MFFAGWSQWLRWLPGRSLSARRNDHSCVPLPRLLLALRWMRSIKSFSSRPRRPVTVVVYRKEASGKEAPLRELHGETTQLADPHGVAVDAKDNLLFANNPGYSYSWDNAGRPIAASGDHGLFSNSADGKELTQ